MHAMRWLILVVQIAKMKTFEGSYFWCQTFLRITNTASQEICVYLCTLRQKKQNVFVYPKCLHTILVRLWGGHLWTLVLEHLLYQVKETYQINKFSFKILSVSVLINLRFGTLCSIQCEQQIEMKHSQSTIIIVIITSWTNLPRIIKSYLQLHCLFIGH